MLSTNDKPEGQPAFFPAAYDPEEVLNLSAKMADIRETQDRLTRLVREQQSLIIANQKLVYRGSH